MFNATSTIRFKFQQNVPKWPVHHDRLNESDDHFKRHLETVENEQDEEEVNAEPLDDLDDEKDEDQAADDEPKVFQDEEVLDEEVSEPVVLKKAPACPSASKTTSVMPTPLAYSRSSSLTSLNSFDAKSIHSTVESEYSQMHKKHGDCSQLDIDDDDDDLDNLLPESPAAPDSSFLKAQRSIHKIKQAECRQNAWKVNSDLSSIMSKLVVNETTTVPIKPKFLQSNQPHPVMSVSYGFLKNANPPLSNLPAPKFLLSSQSGDDSPKVYATVRPGPAQSPHESVCSRMSDASLPSLVAQDMGASGQKFRAVLNSDANFKALFDKLNVPKTERYSSSSSSGSSCSSVIPKLNDELDELDDNSFLNTTTKPVNTPAAVTSLLEDPDDQAQQQEPAAAAAAESLYIDFDLENFIRENFQPSFDDEDKNGSKRASLQSLDVNLNKLKNKNVYLSKKRLSEDNLKIGVLKKAESRGPRTSSASVAHTVAKTKSQPPVVNMTRTAQLRASKTNQNKVGKVEKKPAVVPRVGRVVRPADRFNATVNENSEVKSSSAQAQAQVGSSRRLSIGHGSAVAKKEVPKKPVLSSHNKDLNLTLTCKSSSIKGSRPAESASKTTSTLRTAPSRVVTKVAK